MEGPNGDPQELLDIPSVPLFRLVWHTADAKVMWAPRIEQVRSEWYIAEMESVAAGARPATQQVLTPQMFMQRLPWASKHGLKAIVKRSIKAIDRYSYSYEDGDDQLVVVFSKDGRDETLGYPPCCQEWWDSVFPKYVDPIWQWAGGKDTVSTNVVCNPVLRYLGIRGVPHISCSPTCDLSGYFSRAFTDLMDPKVWGWAKELLSQPMSWDSYRGVAIVKTPLFRVVFWSTPYRERHVVNITSS